MKIHIQGNERQLIWALIISLGVVAIGWTVALVITWASEGTTAHMLRLLVILFYVTLMSIWMVSLRQWKDELEGGEPVTEQQGVQQPQESAQVGEPVP